MGRRNTLRRLMSCSTQQLKLIAQRLEADPSMLDQGDREEQVRALLDWAISTPAVGLLALEAAIPWTSEPEMEKRFCVTPPGAAAGGQNVGPVMLSEFTRAAAGAEPAGESVAPLLPALEASSAEVAPQRAVEPAPPAFEPAPPAPPERDYRQLAMSWAGVHRDYRDEHLPGHQTPAAPADNPPEAPVNAPTDERPQRPPAPQPGAAAAEPLDPSGPPAPRQPGRPQAAEPPLRRPGIPTVLSRQMQEQQAASAPANDHESPGAPESPSAESSADETVPVSNWWQKLLGRRNKERP